MMEGWIKIYRKISENPLWTCEPFTRVMQLSLRDNIEIEK